MAYADTERTSSSELVSWWTRRRTLGWINVLGGIAILGSYAIGISAETGGGSVWGGVPHALRPLYTVSMLTAASGYFAFTYLIFYRLDPSSTRVGRFPYGVFHALYLAILLPSALWMPLTLQMLASPGPALWLVIRAVLAIVGVGSLGLLVALLRLRPRPEGPVHGLAVVGALAFCVQTALLDAIVWPYYFPIELMAGAG
jgi:hypothetical protein